MSFNDRQRTLFDTLAAAEESCHARKQKSRNHPMGGSDGFHRGLSRKMRSETRQFRGRKSMYLKPEDSIFQCLGVRTLPDFKKNPTKWTHYNLEDVPDVTDRSNANAAAICMREIMLTKQNDGEAMDSDEPTDDDKVIFKVPVVPCISISQNSEKKSSTLYRSSKIILPEYVVGRREKNKLSNRDKQRDSNSKRSELKLEHLLDDDDEEDEDNVS